MIAARQQLPPGLAAAQPTTGSSVGFSRNLSLGMSGEDVRVLQQFLNSHGFIIIASGPGSPGHEVAVFGLKTKTALAKWQQANGIRATGFFGPATRARMSK